MFDQMLGQVDVMEGWRLAITTASIIIPIISALIGALWYSLNKRIDELATNQKQFVTAEHCSDTRKTVGREIELQLAPMKDDLRSLCNGGHIATLYGRIEAINNRLVRLETVREVDRGLTPENS